MYKLLNILNSKTHLDTQLFQNTGSESPLEISKKEKKKKIAAINSS